MLKREGLIDVWHDRRIEAGRDIHSGISESLESADIILLLISAYFLASDYCFEVEMQRALLKHDEGSSRVIPIILHPCDWYNSPFGKLRAAPPDGKPVSVFANQNEALAFIARDVREVAETITSTTNTKISLKDIHESKVVTEPDARSSNLRVKKEFSDREVDAYLEESYEYIARYFESSLKELDARNQHITTKFRRVDVNSFTASIYNNGSRTSECTIWMGGRDAFLGGIAYYSGITTSRNQHNESLSVVNDGYTLSLRAFGISATGMRPEDGMYQEGTAELYWGMLMRNLQ